MHFDLGMTVEIEPMRLVDKIEAALALGGWIEQPDTSPIPKFDRMNKSPVGVLTVGGVWVLYPTKSGSEYESAAKTLRTALDKEGVLGSLYSISGDAPYDLNVIHVWVGGKP